ncbi:hypothetical protein GLUCOINTEAF2_0203371 [Komagataeibacter intermedius AF2]|uniref:Uncharacterized protein n=1 Tax=Komagataeibacter intermedius AF2 TaxID=1458464 RepID=A0A0N1N573_9PROT|nr:hypothetical protein GLUCOINTEAF2_0203371 [Komagataeibacter intermedius AF2]
MERTHREQPTATALFTPYEQDRQAGCEREPQHVFGEMRHGAANGQNQHRQDQKHQLRPRHG